ncbi:MAG: hypothetical protein HYU02_00215 [Thaumarchaeota archaeon]|nr:hypothetical protein [Nitrososphaerota archaeon]
MPFELICDNCTFVLYRGNEIRSPKEVLRSFRDRCRGCNTKLSLENFGFEVTVANKHRPTIVGVGQSYLVV